MQQRRLQIEQTLREAGLYPGLQSRSAALGVRAAEGDQVRWILTTEMPATVFDWNRYDFVDEVLLMDGLLLPAVKQVPFLDSHSRYSVDDILGSVSDFKAAEAGGYAAIDGAVAFAADEKSQRTMQKVLDGHLTDGSVGYEVLKSVYVLEGDEISFQGKTYEGPLKITYQWALKEFSGTPIGADALAKVRSLIT
jgi:hypothetical protein